jgi:prepilin-type N-terminal cleavage/methylation domain-containing protein
MCRKLTGLDTRYWMLDARRRRISSRVSGFTLIEVVVASALLVIAIVPILKALTSAHVTTAIIERRTHSLLLAQSKLDNIRARSIYNYMSTFTEANTSLDGPYLCNVVDSGQGTDIRTITVSVGYDLNGSGILNTDEVEVTLVTLVAKRWL